MQQLDPAPEASDYRLAPALAARFVGVLFVLLALALGILSVVVAVLDLPFTVVVVAVAVGVVALAVVAWTLLRGVPVMRLGASGYRVRLVRNAGVTAADWTEVDQAVTASPGGTAVVVLKLRDGRRTTIPVHALAADREEFVRDLQRHLQHGQGLRPL